MPPADLSGKGQKMCLSQGHSEDRQSGTQEI